MSTIKRVASLVVTGFSLTLVTGGCVGYVGDGYGGAVVEGPDFFWGGPYERGHFVHDYSHRGAASRGFAHGGGGGHAGGGGHGGGGGRH